MSLPLLCGSALSMPDGRGHSMHSWSEEFFTNCGISNQFFSKHFAFCRFRNSPMLLSLFNRLCSKGFRRRIVPRNATTPRHVSSASKTYAPTSRCAPRPCSCSSFLPHRHLVDRCSWLGIHTLSLLDPFSVILSRTHSCKLWRSTKSKQRTNWSRTLARPLTLGPNVGRGSATLASIRPS